MGVQKVLLINPNYQGKISSLSQISVGPPLGLAYIAAVLRENEIDVKIIDANAENLRIKEVLSRVRDESPDLIGLTCVTPTINLCGKLGFEIKKGLPEVKIAVGGVHPSLIPADVMENNQIVDFLILGEGEYAFLELVKALGKGKGLEKVKGLVWRNKGRVVVNKKRELLKDLDKLPFPARDLLPNGKYKSIESNHFTTIIAMRGCPGNCIYCAVPNFCGRKLRKRSVDNVIKEIEEFVRRYKVRNFSFLDDTFSYDRKWVIEFCDKMIEKRLNKKVKWFCLTRVDNVDFGLLMRMKLAGCYKIELGIESGSPGILKKIGKGTSVEQIKEAFKAAGKAGMIVFGFVMVGFPFETKKDILMTKRLVKEVKPDFLQVSYATPYPGTAFYEYCRKKGLLKTKDWGKYVFLNKSVVANENGLGLKDIIRLKKDLERSFYLRPEYLIKSFFYLLRNSESLGLFLNRSFTFLRKV